MSTTDPTGVSIGVDIGGTFSDVVLWDGRNRHVVKVLTTPDDPARAVLEAAPAVAALAGLALTDVTRIVHGTTLVTNALIERRGARTALITTAGFKDVIEIGREIRYDMYDLFIEPMAQLIPRDLRFDITERVSSDGRVVQALDQADVEQAVDGVTALGAEAVAVCLLFSYLNPTHEHLIREAFARRVPDLHVSLSCEVVPEIREYERSVTTTCNAYVQPVVERYLARLETGLRKRGFAGDFHLMMSDGGSVSRETAQRFPIRLLESGPAAGALAAVRLGEAFEAPSLLSFDMGGTTAKACVIESGSPPVAPEFEAARAKRFRRGSGLPIRVPAIEMIEVGAGGGSIASIDELGLLQVGPESAGAVPGPACYGRGGMRPTVTDADLLLGYLNPDRFLGGEMRLDVGAAETAIQGLAADLGVSLEAATWGIHNEANQNMALAAEIHAAERGVDVRTLTLVAFGGAGPVHAFNVARNLGVRRVILPRAAGVLSAIGLIIAPVAHHLGRSFVHELPDIVHSDLEAELAALEERGRAIVEAGGVAIASVRAQRSLDVRYVGQALTVSVPVATGGTDTDAISEGFEAEYRRIYGRTMPVGIPEIVTLRVVASGEAPGSAALIAAGSARSPDGISGPTQRLVHNPQSGVREMWPVYRRHEIAALGAVSGPLIIEEAESAAVVGSNAHVRTLGEEHLLVEIDDVP